MYILNKIFSFFLFKIQFGGVAKYLWLACSYKARTDPACVDKQMRRDATTACSSVSFLATMPHSMSVAMHNVRISGFEKSRALFYTFGAVQKLMCPVF
jgi:hypothetical protein